MASFERRDYSLSGGAADAVALDGKGIEGRVEGRWWSPVIPRATRKQLMRRSDGPAWWNFAPWLLLLGASGLIAGLTWGSWWAVPAFFVYGTIYSSSDARWHECGHGTPFRTRWLNKFFYHLCSFMTLREAYLWRWSHSRHHTHTIMVGRDPEIEIPRPADLFGIVADILYLRSGPSELARIVRHAFGVLDGDVRDFVPEAERARMIWSSRFYVAIIGGVGIWSLAIESFLPMMFVATPRFYGGWLHHILALVQHGGLAENVTDHRLNSRTVHINPVFRFLYLNMNYHVEHHVFPMVPFHALPKLHEMIRDQTPPAYDGLWAVYRELVPVLIGQARKHPDRHIRRALPEAAPT